MNQKVNTPAAEISQQELHHLITVATGFIDAYIIECNGMEPMLLPQNIVLSALDSSTNVPFVEWHDVKLPVYDVTHPNFHQGVALVIEGDDASQRFALMCNSMPNSIRIRISEVVDDEQSVDNPLIFQLVKMAEQVFHVPHLSNIQQKLGLSG
jgi:hypothetical protein